MDTPLDTATHRVVIDSGAAVHLTPITSFIPQMRPLDHPISLAGAFGQTVMATHGGAGAIDVGGHTLHVSNLVYAPQLKDTLLSLVRLTKDGHRIDVKNDAGRFVDRAGSVVLPLSGRGNILSF